MPRQRRGRGGRGASVIPTKNATARTKRAEAVCRLPGEGEPACGNKIASGAAQGRLDSAKHARPGRPRSSSFPNSTWEPKPDLGTRTNEAESDPPRGDRIWQVTVVVVQKRSPPTWPPLSATVRSCAVSRYSSNSCGCTAEDAESSEERGIPSCPQKTSRPE